MIIKGSKCVTKEVYYIYKFKFSLLPPPPLFCKLVNFLESYRRFYNVWAKQYVKIFRAAEDAASWRIAIALMLLRWCICVRVIDVVDFLTSERISSGIAGGFTIIQRFVRSDYLFSLNFAQFFRIVIYSSIFKLLIAWHKNKCFLIKLDWLFHTLSFV